MLAWLPILLLAPASLEQAVSDLDGGRLLQAETALRQITEAQPGRYEGHYYLGVTLFRQQKLPEAAQSLSIAAKLNAQSAEAWKALGVAYAASGDYPLADEPFAQACRLGPRLDDACYYYGRNLYALNRFEPSLAALRKALPRDTRPWRVHLGIAQALEALGQAADAEKEFQAAVQGNANASSMLRMRPDEDPRIHYGIFLSRAGRTEEAVQPLSEAVREYPRSPRARYELARVLYQLGKLNDAETELRAALDLNPNDSPARMMLSKTLFRLNRNAEAERELKRAEAQGSGTVK